MTRRPSNAAVWLAVATLTLGACGDQGPVSGPGTLTGSVRSPHGPEGAAVLVLVGEGVGAVMQAGGADVHAHATSEGTRVVLVHPDGGDLDFRLELADTTRLPRILIEEVAAPDDELRMDLSGYSVEVGR
jgi:hypothetical protein